MSVLNTATTDSAAQLIKINADPRHDGFQIIRGWMGIHPTAADGLITTMYAVDTYGSPKADAQTYSGKFIQSNLEPSLNIEGSVDIIQTLTKVTKVTSHTSLPPPMKTFSRQRYDPIVKDQGKSRTLVLDYMYIDPATDTKCMVLTDTSLEKKAGTGWHLISAKTEIQNDRTVTFTNIFMKDTWASIPETAYVIRNYSPENEALNSQETEILEWPNLSDTLATVIYSSAISNKANMANARVKAPTGHVLSIINKLANNGRRSYSVTRETVKPIDDWSTGASDTRYFDQYIRRGDGTVSRTIVYGIRNYQCTSIDCAIKWLNDSSAHGEPLINSDYVQPRTGRIIATAQWVDTEY